jgi:hypothetical protein
MFHIDSDAVGPAEAGTTGPTSAEDHGCPWRQGGGYVVQTFSRKGPFRPRQAGFNPRIREVGLAELLKLPEVLPSRGVTAAIRKKLPENRPNHSKQST